MRFTILASVLALATSLTAQNCANLTISGDGTPGTTLSFALSGAGADSPAVILAGPNTGSTAIQLGPIGSIELGLAAPFVPLLFGQTDANGNVTLEIPVPMAPIPQTSLFAQGLTIEFVIGRGRPTFNGCTSGVEGFSIGSST